MSRLTKYEMETIVNFNEAEAVGNIYTCNRALRRKLEQWAQERPNECRLDRVSRFGEAVAYFVPKSWVHIYPPRQISEEQRSAMAARMKEANLRQKTPTAQGDYDRIAAQTGNYIPQPSDPQKSVEQTGKLSPQQKTTLPQSLDSETGESR